MRDCLRYEYREKEGMQICNVNMCWLIGRVENGLEGDLHEKDGWSSCL